MRWVLNVATSYLKFLINMVVVFFLTPFIVSRIGIDLFGLWTLIFSIVGIFGLMDFGFATAGVKYVAETIGSGDTEGRNRILGTLFSVYTAIGVLCIIAVAIVAGPAAGWFDLTAEQGADLTDLVWFLGIVVALGFPLSVFRAAMTGAGRMDLVNGIALIAVLAQAALTVVLLDEGWGLMGLGIATAVNLLGQTVFLIPFAYRMIPGFSVSPRHFSRPEVKELLSFSIYAFLANIAVLIILRIDPVVIKLFLPLSAVAIYAIAAKVGEYTYLLNKQFSNALMPLVSQSRGAGDHETIVRVLVDGTRFLMGISIPFIALLWFYTPEIIAVWMGPDFAASTPLLRILLIAVFFSTLQLNAANVLGMTGHHKFVAWSMAGSAGLNLILSLILIQFFELTGVATATLIAAFTVEMLVIIPRACASQQTAFMKFIREGLLPALPAAVPMLALAFALAAWKAPADLLWIVIEGGICALVYFAVFAFTGVKAEERALVAGKLKRMRK
jgi:O-antigen/teichoic acid export membrane protein